MNYEDTISWPDIPVEEVDREELETIYSFGHYDGPGTGLIKWKEEYYWADRFEIGSDRYWIIKISSDHAQRLLKWGQDWAHFFSSAMSWNPNGTRKPDQPGIYCTNLPFKGTQAEYERRRKFYQEWHQANPLETPPMDAKVVGYFRGW